MLPKLSHTEAFKKEFELFTKQVNFIKDATVREELNSDLKKLYQYATEIDVGHSSEFNGMINPALLADKRTDLNNLRFNIKNKLKKIKLQ